MDKITTWVRARHFYSPGYSSQDGRVARGELPGYSRGVSCSWWSGMLSQNKVVNDDLVAQIYVGWEEEEANGGNTPQD